MKKLTVAATLLALILLLAACGSTQSPASPPQTSESVSAAPVSEPASMPEPPASEPESVPEPPASEPEKPTFAPPENYNDVAQTAAECDAIRAQIDYTLFEEAYFEHQLWDLYKLGEESYPVREFLVRAGFYHDAFASPAEIDQNALLGNMISASRACAVGESYFGDEWYNYSDALFPILNSIIADPTNEFVTQSGCSMYLKEQVEDAVRYFFGDTISVTHRTVENSPGWAAWTYYEKEGVYVPVPTGGLGFATVLKALTDNGDGTITAEAVYLNSSYGEFSDPDNSWSEMPNFRIVIQEGDTERSELDFAAMKQYFDERSVRHILTLKVLPDGGYNILSQTLDYPND